MLCNSNWHTTRLGDNLCTPDAVTVCTNDTIEGHSSVATVMDLWVEAHPAIKYLSTVVCCSTSEFLVSVCIRTETLTNLKHFSGLQQ